MSKLDDFLEPLHNGVREVTIPKTEVTEPLGPEWIRSAINVPSAGTVASYRKGRYHVHETATEWKVHLDRYDPKARPVMHLVDDAPLIFMIGATISALIDTVLMRNIDDSGGFLSRRRTAWQMCVLFGLVLVTAGVFAVLNPIPSFHSIVHVAIPLIFVGLGAAIAGTGIRTGPFGIVSLRRMFAGIVVVLIGLLSYIFAVKIWGVAIFVLIALWGIGSAITTLGRVSRGRSAVPEGFYRWLAVGILSLLLAGLIFVTPAASVALLTMTMGVVTLLAGLALIANGFRLWRRPAPR